MSNGMSVPPIVTRPAIVTGTGAVALAFGALATFVALWNLVLPPLMHVPAEMPGNLPPPLDLFADMWRYRPVLACIQAALGVLVLVAARGLFRLKPWARWLLEGAVWLVFVSYVFIAAIWAYRWSGVVYDDRTAWARPIAVFGGLVILFWAAMFGVAIAFLRSSKLRGALLGTRAA